MKEDKQLSITESSDFYLLLELMLPLYQKEEYACLPELFSIIGHEKLIELCKYAGGSTVRIPTVDELTSSIEALDWYYQVYISHRRRRKSIPTEYIDLVDDIKEILDAKNSQTMLS